MTAASRRLTGRVAVVTGAASGIGAATAARLAEEGAAVVLADIAERGDDVATGLRAEGYRAAFVSCDVSREDDWTMLAGRVHRLFGPLDVLCSSAFTHRNAAAHELTRQAWDEGLAVNLTPLFLGVRTFLEDLRARRGSVIAISSVHAHFGLPGRPGYAAAKGGLTALVRQLAVEYGPEGIRVNAILPGPILTPAWDGIDDAGRRASAAATALERLGDPDEIASAVAFLASSDASYITGAELVVDGGWSVSKESR
ncbi:SDR family oxidoreductase [Nocardia sp. NEAU-G5]|uniref:SDR family oxidoreductase n=1 Tax=Nocardia albiluteola TaxID=2842303 RepID=A0ABS6B3R5_9NOCA|nr:SDR family oxidoreductase [Nocardia albiluteola]MBU3063883.1 SDR family oxidoreductase [Nocardia albiluteola]